MAPVFQGNLSRRRSPLAEPALGRKIASSKSKISGTFARLMRHSKTGGPKIAASL
jgi:hypothetical protein